MSHGTRVLVCTKCHLLEAEEEALPFPQRDGGKLLRAVKTMVKGLGLPAQVQGSRCIGCCDAGQKCGALIETPGKDTQVLSNLPGEQGAEIVVDYLQAHLRVRKRVRSKRDLANPAWSKYFLIRIPGRRVPGAAPDGASEPDEGDPDEK